MPTTAFLLLLTVTMKSSSYNPQPAILDAEITMGINPKDLLWIAYSETENPDDSMTGVFGSFFHHKIDMVGDSIDTPEGYT